MSNIVKIEILNEYSVNELLDGKVDSVLEAPLLDDIVASAKSNFSNFAELVPVVDTIKKQGMAFFSSVSNELSAGMVELANKIDIPRWQATDPFRLAPKIMFYTKTDPYTDVFLPAKILQAQSILTFVEKDGKQTYITPGISTQTMSVFGTTGTKKNSSAALKKSKLVSIEIPGVIYIPLAMVESAVPTFSKQRTESGYPLWASVDLQIMSVRPANTQYYDFVIGEGKAKENISGKTIDNSPKQASATGQVNAVKK